MPESPVQNLPLATTIKDRDRTVLEQDNEAKGMMMQDLIRYMFTASDKGGVWGIHVGSNQPAGTQNLWIDTSTSPVTLKIRDTKYPDIWASVPVISQPITQDDFRKWNLDINHPVGSWWISDDPVNPAKILGGGEWLWQTDMFLLAADENGVHPVGSTGGEEEVKLTIEQLPPHSFKINTPPWTYAEREEGSQVIGSSGDTYAKVLRETNTVGKGKPVNIMPPFYATYMWRRIA